MRKSLIHTSNATDPDVSIAGNEVTDMKEAGPGSSNVQTDTSSNLDDPSPVPMDVD